MRHPAPRSIAWDLQEISRLPGESHDLPKRPVAAGLRRVRRSPPDLPEFGENGAELSGRSQYGIPRGLGQSRKIVGKSRGSASLLRIFAMGPTRLLCALYSDPPAIRNSAPTAPTWGWVCGILDSLAPRIRRQSHMIFRESRCSPPNRRIFPSAPSRRGCAV